MKRDDTITVIAPVFNVAGYLDDCLRSVAAQTHANLEILVVDDGSFDGSDVLCDQWARSDPRVAVIHQRNRGLSVARNIGLDLTSGEFVLFVDSDDVVERAYAEELYRAITDMGTPCVTCGYGAEADDGGEIVCRPTVEPTVVSARECISRAVAATGMRSGNMPIAVWTKIYRRSLFNDAALRFPEGEVYEDLSVLVPIMRACGRVGLIPDVLYHKRSRLDSISRTISAPNLRDYEVAVDRFAQAVKTRYPDLGAAVDRRAERGRVANAIRWSDLQRMQGGGEARDGFGRARRLAVEHWRDLVVPADLPWLFRLLILCAMPGLIPALHRAAVFFRRQGLP